MLCIYNSCTDVYFNLAAEEYLLKNFQDDIFMLWQNEPSVIIGKHQNVWDEINFGFVEKNQIKVARRFSGGGAVYHDEGNLNLTFIRNDIIKFDQYTGYILEILEKIGIQAQTDSRHNIYIDGLKISGSAQYIYKNRTMFHATLLFSSQLMNLVASLKVSPIPVNSLKNTRIYIPSVRSSVTNICEYLTISLTIQELKNIIMDYFFNKDEGNMIYTLNEYDENNIRSLMKKKYMLKEWNWNK